MPKYNHIHFLFNASKELYLTSLSKTMHFVSCPSLLQCITVGLLSPGHFKSKVQNSESPKLALIPALVEVTIGKYK